MHCDDIRELMSSHLDGRLDAAGEQRLTEHLAVCVACRQDLAALQRVVGTLQQLPVVTPPLLLTARIQARVQAARRPQASKILFFLNLPQTRVALAASLLIVVSTLGIRHLMIEQAAREDARPPVAAKVEVFASGERASSRAACVRPDSDTAKAELAPATAVAAVPQQNAGKPEEEAVAANNNDRVDAPAAACDALQKRADDKELVAEKKVKERVVFEGRRSIAAEAPSKIAADRLPAAPVARQVRSEKGVVSNGQISDGYTFRTDRIAEAMAIVENYRDKPRSGLDGDYQQETAKKVRRAAQSNVVEIALAPTAITSLLEALRGAGAVLEHVPVAVDGLRNLPSSSENLVSGGALGFAAPATNGVVRFIFLPVK